MNMKKDKIFIPISSDVVNRGYIIKQTSKMYTWVFTLNDMKHTVQFDSSPLVGKLELTVDGKKTRLDKQ